MPVSHIPPIPAEPDAGRLAPEGDFVESGALKLLLLGAMPTAGDGGRLVNGRPPRDEYAGFGEGMVPAPVETPLPVPVAAARQVLCERDQAGELRQPAIRREKRPAAGPAQPDRVPVKAAEMPSQAGEPAERVEFRRPPAPRPVLVERRAAPPRVRRLREDPEAAFGRSQPRLAGIWVMLSSAAASIVLLLLTSVGLSRYGHGSAEPVPLPAVPGGSEEVAETVDVPRPPRLAAAEQEEF